MESFSGIPREVLTEFIGECVTKMLNKHDLCMNELLKNINLAQNCDDDKEKIFLDFMLCKKNAIQSLIATLVTQTLESTTDEALQYQKNDFLRFFKSVLDGSIKDNSNCIMQKIYKGE